MKKLTLPIIVLIIVLSLSACIPNQNEIIRPTDDTVIQPLPPVDSDNMLTDIAYISESQLLIMESFPVQIMVNLMGDLPTACHTFQTNYYLVNSLNEIHIEVFSEYDGNSTCIQGLQPFEENISIPMDKDAEGIFTIWINSEKIGEFSYPG